MIGDLMVYPMYVYRAYLGVLLFRVKLLFGTKR